MKRRSPTTFYCFSPPVMLATLLIESSLAIWTLWRYKMSSLTRLVATALVSLAVFQFCEYHVCQGWGSAALWARLGYVAISALPPLGLHILHLLAGKPQRRLVYAAYATMAGYMAYFLLWPSAFVGYQCTGNYVIFQIGLGPAIAYGLYYYGWLWVAISLGFIWLRRLKGSAQQVLLQRKTIQALIIGYLVFLVPTAVANTVKPSTKQGIPSIMCGFAVLFALILALYVMPRTTAKRRQKAVAQQK